MGHAGELAILCGLLPWTDGSARKAAVQMAAHACHAGSSAEWDRVRAGAEVRRLIEDHQDRIVDLDVGPAAANGTDSTGWPDRDHVYLRSDVVRNDVVEVDDLLASLDGIPAPVGGKRARGTRKSLPLARMSNQRWSLDFVADTSGTSRKFRILAVIDVCCRENLRLVPDTSMSGARVARELDALVRSMASRLASSVTTSWVRSKWLLEASDHGASERLDALKMVARAGSAVKKWSLP